MTRICLVPQVQGVGGMVSFQAKFSQGLRRRGIEISLDLADRPYDAVLVIGGTRDLGGLAAARRRGVPIVQRLNGMNWIQRKRRTGLRHFLRAEYGNFMLSLIRRRLASGIVYQSRFARDWWERVYGKTPVPDRVVYNGVDLDQYSPLGAQERPQDRSRILLVEGSLGGGYELGLETAVGLAERLVNSYSRNVELMIVGKVSEALKATWTGRSKVPLVFAGLVGREEIPFIDRSAHLLYAADIQAACPNSTVEALACGLPVVSFDTGALPELVTGAAGRVVPYGADPWKLEPPDLDGLAGGAAEVLADQPRFRQAARERAEAALGLEHMLDGYLGALLGASID
jgi:glycosyltransferase involved in cell wall biosynthesis